MIIKKISKTVGAQDGAIFGEILLRMDARGKCSVYNMKDILSNETPVPVCAFSLDRADEICPHSNSVVFGNEYYNDGDEFPLLYTNIYNNYAKQENKRKGICCVYRLMRNGHDFKTELVGLIEIGFVEARGLWASETGNDVRPYGNFVIDTDNSIYYAFTMIDDVRLTRYFSFKLPDLSHWSVDPEFGVKKILLTEKDILDSFDCEYHNFIQGAVMHRGYIYSTEGFSTESGKPPRLRVIDVANKREVININLADMGIDTEPEFIDFYGDTCIYSDGQGDIYTIEIK